MDAEPFRFSLRKLVEFHETDMAGVVHFANLFKYFEIAETAFFRSVGLSVFDPDRNVRWPRLHVSCDFVKPLHFGETVEIGLRVKQVKGKTAEFEFVVLTDPDGARQTAARGTSIVAFATFDAAERRIRALPIPDGVAAALTGAGGA